LSSTAGLEKLLASPERIRYTSGRVR